MINIIADQLLQFTSHRPFALPDKHWLIYQQWTDVLFLHSPVTPELVKPLLPRGLKLDTISGLTWVSMVLFAVSDMRMRLLPVPLLPAFNELNLRTYVHYDNIPGIYFLQIKANSKSAVLLTNFITKLRYQYGDLQRFSSHHYGLTEESGSKMLDIDFLPGQYFDIVPTLDRWLTERYCCYQDDGEKLYRYDIHHPKWPLYQVQTNHHTLRYSFHDWKLTETSVHLMHFSPLQSALIWPRKRVA
jgi:uncharacterized protein